MSIGVERAGVLGIQIDAVTSEDVLRFARDRIAEGKAARAVTVNAEFVIRAQRDAEFREVLNRADLATPDSAGIAWALRRRGIQLPEPVRGADLIQPLCRQAAELGQRVFLLGARPGVAEAAARQLQSSFPGLQIAGTHAGTPNREDEDAAAELVRGARTDILFVAFGAPDQDVWVARNLDKTGALFAMGVGGSFDYLAGVARRAPRWMRKRNLEWLWRLVMQPWRWRRMLALPKFAWLVLRDSRS